MTANENTEKNTRLNQEEIDATNRAAREASEANERSDALAAEAGVGEDDAQDDDAPAWSGASPVLADEVVQREWNLDAWESAATTFRNQPATDEESTETEVELQDADDESDDDDSLNEDAETSADDADESGENAEESSEETSESSADAGASETTAAGKPRRRRRGGRNRRGGSDAAPSRGGKVAAPSTERARTEATHADADDDDAPKRRAVPKPKVVILVNDNPGEEMRIAILENNTLAQYFSERAATATNVGSIYKARVLNVEPAIQAAFVDFGEGANGFLHISDLHPKYFPGVERTEKVGRKIPRHDRPMMQHALKRGQEILVQVLKEGLGSKGPTVTSYLSLPGRLLVMMPDMDNIGVSRKVDDEDQRRAMRKILDSLELQEGFGFILRTAGFDATRTELMRDAQYLTRLWQQLEKRMHAVGAPCQLYAEGDVLLRTIRDGIDGDVEAIIVDSESAFRRAKAFLEVVAPRASELLRYWDRSTPLFYAFDVERQIELIHSREVPLPSGGALVFDQTEALVAIDVNSGRSRSARDSETNAYNTNIEAVDEICRQLRLRDLGGLVVADLIDMRSMKHRREIEDRMRANLHKDRAKSTVAQISEFGMIELTRQRMRPSMRKTHYHDCPACSGTGDLRNPDAVASDAMRRLAAILDLERVRRVEIVVGAKVAAAMLSTMRRALVEIEDEFGKTVTVRISEAIPPDRADFYAYDDRDADIELERMPRLERPTISRLPATIAASDEQENETGGDGEQGEGGGRRRRRRRRKPAAADATALILAGTFDDLPDLDAAEPTVGEALKRDAAKRAQEASLRVQAEIRERHEGLERASREALAQRERDFAEAESAARARAFDRAVAEALALRATGEIIKVFELAKELSQASKDVLALCLEIGLGKKSHMTKLSGAEADALRMHYGALPLPEPDPERLEALTAEELATVAAEFSALRSSDDGDSSSAAAPQGGRKRRRRGRGRSRGDRDDAPAAVEGKNASDAAQDGGSAEDAPSEDGDSNEPRADGAEGGGRKRRRRRGGRGRSRGEDRPKDAQASTAAPSQASEPSRAESSGDDANPSHGENENREGGGRGRRGRGRRGGRGGRSDQTERGRQDAAPAAAPRAPKHASSAPAAAPAAAAAPVKRGLYARNRKLAPGERPTGDDR